MLNALLVADFHEYKIRDDRLRAAVEGRSVDLIISCGDVPYATLEQFKERFPGVAIYGVHGNHCPGTPLPDGIVDLHGTVVKKGLLTFSGFEGALRYKDAGHYLYDDPDVEHLLRRLPPVDVMVSHAPPRGIHDGQDFAHMGFEAFRQYIDQKIPRYWIHGHAHQKDRVTPIGETFVISVYGFKFVRLELAPPEPETYTFGDKVVR
jgi:hypothetical protein